MDMNTFIEVLKISAPVISSAITILAGFMALIKSIKTIKTQNDTDRKQTSETLLKLEKKISETNTKVKSIEKYLNEREKK